MSYWDTSALVKLFAVESDSEVFRRHVAETRSPLVTAEFARLELWTALRRKEADSQLGGGEARVLLEEFDMGCVQKEWTLLPDSADVRAEFERIVEQCFSQSTPVRIRTLDALHIAAAHVAEETEIVAADNLLRKAATLFGFQLFPTPTP